MTEKTPRHKKNDTNCFSLVRSAVQFQLCAAVTAMGGQIVFITFKVYLAKPRLLGFKIARI